MSDLMHRFVKIGDLLPIHARNSHKTGSKLFSWPIETREIQGEHQI